MLDILKSEGNFVIKFVALTLKIISVHYNCFKRGPQTYNNGSCAEIFMHTLQIT